MKTDENEDREMFRQLLGAVMSNLSEFCWCAGWMSGAEDEIPRLCRTAVETNESQRWGQQEIPVASAKQVLRLAELAGGWVDCNPKNDGPEYIPYTPEEIQR